MVELIVIIIIQDLLGNGSLVGDPDKEQKIETNTKETICLKTKIQYQRQFKKKY